MKISKLRIKNLNSLKGEFCLDFNGDPLGNSGIFAITGPTGAGKTTILDAICVALFGQTPRLGAGESEELMSQHTGECYAEVEFSVRDGNFRSKWSQRRARGKADGKLQPTAMELSELSSDGDKIIEDKKSRVPLKVEEITGLDFPRFTRSVLLAQGSFATFLNANENERADLLEKMTGTEIYSFISQGVYNRAKDERQKLSDLSIRKESLSLMPSNEVEALKTDLKEKRAAAKKVSLSLIKLQGAIKWLKDQNDLEKTALEIQEALKKISEEQVLMKPEFERLENHLKVAPMKGNYEILEKVRIEITQLSDEIKRLEKTIPEIEIKLKSIEDEKRSKENEFSSFKKEKDEQEKRISKAELKDHEIVAQQKSLEEQRKAKDSIQEEIKKLNRQETETRKEINTVSNEIDGCNRYLRENEKDAGLASNLPLIQERLKQLTEHREKHKDLEDQRKKTTLKNSDLAKQLKATSQELEKIEKELKDYHTEKAEKEPDLKALLSGKPIDDFENEKAQIEKRKIHIESITKLASELKECNEKKADLKKNLITAGNTRTELDNHHKELGEAIKRETDIISQLEDKWTHEMMIVKYEEDRKHLKTDIPCPLCGSPEHPWAVAGMVPEPEGTEAVLKKQKKQLDKLQKEAADTSVKIAETNSSLKHLERDEKELAEKQTRLSDNWNSDIKTLSVDLNYSDQKELQELSETTAMELGKYERLIKQVKELKSLLDKLNEQINGIEMKRADLNLEHSKIENEKKQAEKELQRLQKDMEFVKSDIQNLLSACADQLNNYGEPVPDPGTEKALLKRLKDRNKQFGDAQSRRETFEKQLGPLREKTSGLESSINAQKEREVAIQKETNAFEKTISNLLSERKALIGDGDPQKLKKDLKVRQSKYESTIKQFEKQISETQAELASNKALLKARKKENDDKSADENRLKKEFLKKLKNTGFTEEADFQAALMEPIEAKRLQGVQKDIHERNLQEKTRLEDNQKRLNKMRLEPLTTQSLDEVEKQHAEEEQHIAEIQNRIGEIQGTMKRQESLRKEQENLLKDIEKQEKESVRWDKLNALIGSADGKKFRRYAQGLTLDYLIQLANTNLSKLNDRYVLQREKDQELSIEVIDTYQADVTRPTQTLSGGETFLVSLALALGLSNLAGRNTTIDSLFLDEGFGSLDAETLETALAAIDTLHASGKTIGVISHIEALKERIPVQIQVQGLSGGVSDLRIVG